jgi:Zn-dependent M28 family amino/carboxypeptidase
VKLKMLFACALVLAFAASPSMANAADVNTTGLRKAVKPENVFKHQADLETIADANGSTRDTRTPGYQASVDYVVSQLKSYGYKPQIVQFNLPEWVENSTPVLTRTDVDPDKSYIPGTAADDDSPSVDFITFELSPSGNLTNLPVVPTNDIQIPSTGGSTSGCEAGDYPAAVNGAIALIQRGTCPFVQKLSAAQDANAAGVILFNEGDTPGRMNALFRSGPADLGIPAVHSSYAVGEELYNAYKAGQNPTVSMTIDAQVKDRFFPQVLAETRGGDPKSVEVVGAHLDSVAAGPGVNDDGSGTSAQLEIAKQIARKHLKPRHKIRFAWWGGEEEGLIGSLYYSEHLPASEVDKIMVMLDFDMISSPNFARLVYDGDGSEAGNPAGPAGSGEVERVFVDFWRSQGFVSEPIPFDGRSDYVGFTNLGIPAGGIFAGAEAPKTAAQEALYGGAAGEQLDPCYHAFCDRLGSILGAPPPEALANPANAAKMQGGGRRSMEQFLPAVTHAIWHFAKAKNPLPARAAAMSRIRAARTVRGARKARASARTTRNYRFKYRGHELARPR